MTPRIAIIGVGSIGQRHAKNLLLMGHKDIIGLDNFHIVGDGPIPMAASYESVWNFCPTHALICSPPDMHFAHANLCLEKGLHTFVEKPLAPSIGYCEYLEVLAMAKAKTLAIGYMERANPTVQTAMDFITEHEAKNVYIECFWKMTQKTYKQDMLLESSHALDTARFVCGHLELESCTVTDTRAEIKLTHKSGLNCYVTIDCDALPMRRINIYAHDGAYLGSQYGTTQEEWDLCYREELRAFLAGQPLCDAYDATHVAKLIAGCRNA